MDRPLEVVSLVRSAALDGVILAPPAADHPDIRDGLSDARIPFRRIAPQSRLDVGLSTAMADRPGAREMAEHGDGRGPRNRSGIMGRPTPAARSEPRGGTRQAIGANGCAGRA